MFVSGFLFLDFYAKISAEDGADVERSIERRKKNAIERI